MHKWLVSAAFGWLTLTGIAHFVVDVVSHHVRGVHPPGAQTTLLYYGLHSAYALGQAAFGALGLLVAVRALPLLGTTPPLALALLAGLGWLAISFLFSPYLPPRINAAVFCALVIAAWLARPSSLAG